MLGRKFCTHKEDTQEKRGSSYPEGYVLQHTLCGKRLRLVGGVLYSLFNL